MNLLQSPMFWVKILCLGLIAAVPVISASFEWMRRGEFLGTSTVVIAALCLVCLWMCDDIVLPVIMCILLLSILIHASISISSTTYVPHQLVEVPAQSNVIPIVADDVKADTDDTTDTTSEQSHVIEPYDRSVVSGLSAV